MAGQKKIAYGGTCIAIAGVWTNRNRSKFFLERKSMLAKAREHLGSAEALLEQGRYRDVVSRAYYAVFSAMQDYVGPPPKGKWEHPGLRGAFIRKLQTEGTTVEQCRELRKRLRFLHSAREDADYTVGSIDERTAQETIQLGREILALVSGGEQV